MDLGSANKVKNLISTLAFFGPLMFLRGMGSGKWVEEHMTMRRYWFSFLVQEGAAHKQ